MFVATTESSSVCKNIVVKTGDGRVFKLGNPNSIFYPLRLKWYLFKRRKELKNG